MTAFETGLSALVGTRVVVSADERPRDAGEAPVHLSFSTGAVLTAAYWRIIRGGRAGNSSFDHEQIYGLPTPINAIRVLRELLTDHELSSATLEYHTGDLVFAFGNDVVLQVFNFTGFETWEMRFADGTVEYSNYNK